MEEGGAGREGGRPAIQEGHPPRRLPGQACGASGAPAPPPAPAHLGRPLRLHALKHGLAVVERLGGGVDGQRAVRLQLAAAPLAGGRVAAGHPHGLRRGSEHAAVRESGGSPSGCCRPRVHACQGWRRGRRHGSCRGPCHKQCCHCCGRAGSRQRRSPLPRATAQSPGNPSRSPPAAPPAALPSAARAASAAAAGAPRACKAGCVAASLLSQLHLETGTHGGSCGSPHGVCALQPQAATARRLQAAAAAAPAAALPKPSSPRRAASRLLQSGGGPAWAQGQRVRAVSGREEGWGARGGCKQAPGMSRTAAAAAEQPVAAWSPQPATCCFREGGRMRGRSVAPLWGLPACLQRWRAGGLN